ncbi:hypothetical protein [Frankia sp. CiP3]|uniref:hypothetical protein n=1 Tax=Frankia sp. CiP3 TaxID=2880971 RepID=UPI001EF49FA4|nr:hypothetical protein [Frankia sp. CiP3]
MVTGLPERRVQESPGRFGFCSGSAGRTGMAGGDIRNAVVTAAYLGAANGRLVGMRDLVTAISLEYRKLGRLCLPDEFGPYTEVLHARESRGQDA